MQVVVPEHCARPVAEVGDEPQHVERTRAAVDEIAGEPEPIAAAIEVNLVQQRSQLGVASLHVPDYVGGHALSPLRDAEGDLFASRLPRSFAADTPATGIVGGILSARRSAPTG